MLEVEHWHYQSSHRGSCADQKSEIGKIEGLVVVPESWIRRIDRETIARQSWKMGMARVPHKASELAQEMAWTPAESGQAVPAERVDRKFLQLDRQVDSIAGNRESGLGHIGSMGCMGRLGSIPCCRAASSIGFVDADFAGVGQGRMGCEIGLGRLALAHRWVVEGSRWRCKSRMPFVHR